MRRFARPLAVCIPTMLLPAMLLGGCATRQPTQILSDRNDHSGYGMGLDSRDFTTAAQTAVQKMLASGALDHPGGGRYVVAISRVTNDTMQRIDTDRLVKKIRVAILNSGKAVVTTAIGGAGAEDDLSMRTRELRGSKEFAQKNVGRQHQMVAPELSLSGKILQNNITVDSGQRAEYAFQLTLTDLQTGLGKWEDEETVNKLGSNDSVAW